ncbi:MAG: S28 family serine protease [Candidatus Aminicenantes bacterium]|jgi:hypothetical protein
MLKTKIKVQPGQVIPSRQFLFALIGVSIIFFLASCSGQSKEIAAELEKIPGLIIQEMDPDSPIFQSKYEIKLIQPLDHENPEAGFFLQRMFLSHAGFNRPMVLVTEGYAAGKNYVRELAEILNANELQVEYRYFGESKPESIDWDYLTYHQSSFDYHRIYSLFKTFYKKRWVSAGWSKGGQTSLIYRRHFPEDMAAVIAYDAPANLALEEPRIDEFFEHVGDEVCRYRLILFQRSLLRSKQDILPLYKAHSEKKGYTFRKISPLKAFEYTVLEYPFSFWQYHTLDCSAIPGERATPQEMFDHLREVVSLSSYTDSAFNSAAMKQFATELGYYRYVIKNVRDLLSEGEDDYPNKAFAPQEADLTFDPTFMEDINKWLLTQGNNILYIYGENDPWSAPHLEYLGATNARMFWAKNGNHFSFIRTLSEVQQEDVFQTLETWLGITIER